MTALRVPFTAVRGWEDMNPRWVCWAVSQGLNPRTAGDDRRKNPARYEMFTIWIMRRWSRFDATRGYPPYWPHSERDHAEFTQELALETGVDLVESSYEGR